ncbi:MAG: permease-like cell division protein FtsX [Bacteroidales bacterium]|jgi:cell division transport system permease protein|nr:permease-like cell division protein FtsX [Bacteroidales bacterium]HOL97907.1 permease-like cell division protein FtsX [Bacteroidales bacterium]HOM35651.1 permease-like cell division protein FtsX [Bacteroidales bacterium]HPD22788.1 permease-like cell division protein FtsX [Bacteroidales bacterium]HRS98949.1 permease-like cell division protein FtsX [Bacteroidales bacterium]
MKESKIKNKIRSAYTISLISISMVLLLLGIIGLLILNAGVLSKYVRENINFSVLIHDNIKEPDIKLFKKTLDTQHFVKSTEYINKDDAAKQLQEELGEDFLQTLGYNPLSPTINIYLKSEYANPDSIKKIETWLLSNTEMVSEVAYQHNLVQLINKNIRKISIILFFFAAIFLIISFALLNNTVRLMIYSKRFTINTMKLVGAKNSFIRKPFLLSGLVQGFLSSVISLIILSFIVNFYNKQLGEMISLLNLQHLIILYLIIIFIGISLTLISTYFSINKYLRLKTSELYY